MNTAFHEHLNDQREAAVRDFREASDRMIRSLGWTRNMCFAAFALAMLHFLFETNSWAWEATSRLIWLPTLLLLVRIILHLRQRRTVNRLELQAKELTMQMVNLHLEELGEIMRDERGY